MVNLPERLQYQLLERKKVAIWKVFRRIQKHIFFWEQILDRFTHQDVLGSPGDIQRPPHPPVGKQGFGQDDDMVDKH